MNRSGAFRSAITRAGFFQEAPGAAGNKRDMTIPRIGSPSGCDFKHPFHHSGRLLHPLAVESSRPPWEAPQQHERFPQIEALANPRPEGPQSTFQLPTRSGSGSRLLFSLL